MITTASFSPRKQEPGKKLPNKLNGNLWQDIIAKPLKERKLRVGYLSADFANHPVGRFMLPILNNHDKAVVEVWANCGSHDDWITEHIRKSIDHWVDLRFRTITEGARIVADLGLDRTRRARWIFSRFTIRVCYVIDQHQYNLVISDIPDPLI